MLLMVYKMSLRPRPLPTKPTRTLDDVLAVGLALQQTRLEALSLQEEEAGVVDSDDDLDSILEIDAILGVDQVSIDKRMRRRVTLSQRIRTLAQGGGSMYFRLLYYGYQQGPSVKRLGKLQDRRSNATSVQIGTLRLVGKEFKVTITHRLNRSSNTPLEKLDNPYENGTTRESFFRGVYMSAMQSLGFFAKPRSKPFHYAAVRYVAENS